MSDYGKGAMASPPDPRDFDITKTDEYISTAATANPPDYDVLPVPPLYYQDGLPECYAFAGARLTANLQRHDPKVGRWVSLDGHRFAQIVKAHDGIAGPGSNGRSTLSAAQKYGVPVLNNPAVHYHVGPYYRVPLNIEVIKTAIRAFGVLIFALPWPESWDHTPLSGTLPPRAGAEAGHMFTLDGWRSRGVAKAANQWYRVGGPNWGSKGRFYIPWHEVTTHGWECWKALDVPGEG